MIKYCKFYLFVVLSLIFASCEKKETAITLPAKGDGEVLQVDMGSNYDFQYFISLQNNQIVHISPTKNWDLAFSCDPNSHAVFLNGAKLMSAINTRKTNFADVGTADTNDKVQNWKYDNASGLIDSTVLGDWKGKNDIYLIKLSNTSNKVRKIRFLSEDIFEYKIEVSDFPSAVPTTITIPKRADRNYTYFSFDYLAEVENVEPAKSGWDLQVTLYNYTFYDQNPILPYIVNGILLNPSGTAAYKDSLSEYTAINADFALAAPLSTRKDVIGYDWKKYDIDKNLYSVESKYNYIVKTKEGSYFKLRFLDFYSSTGVKGSPKFEFQQLK
ncbi:MAG: HmuY family protein [Chitinophagaceae bacterium]|nr:HmuY family protein [Chitinophagaceae bacterium]